MEKLYIIEARKDGQLIFDCPQPEEVFGNGAITGISDWAMSRTIFALKPDAVLTGDTIPTWPTLLNPFWIAREKTW